MAEYRTPITVDGSKVAGTFKDFELLVKNTCEDILGARKLFFSLDPKGKDRLEAKPPWWEHPPTKMYNYKTGEVNAMVTVPHLEVGKDTVFYMHYQKPWFAGLFDEDSRLIRWFRKYMKEGD